MAVLLAVGSSPAAEIIPGQAVSWTDFSHITGIALGHDYAYFATTEGIVRYSRYERRWEDPITASDGLWGGAVRRLAVSFDDNRISAETDGGIYNYLSVIGEWRFDAQFESEYYRNSDPRTPLPNLLMPLGYTMYRDGYVEDNSFRRFDITAWREDDYDKIYVGTWGLGPMIVDDLTLETDLVPCGLLQKATDAIYIDGDSLWLGGNAGDAVREYAYSRYGVTLYDRAAQRFSYFEPRYLPGFDSEIIYDIAGDDKNIYFAGRQGLTVMSRKSETYYTMDRGDGLPDDEATAVTVAHDSVWIGTPRGLAFLDPSVDTVKIVGGDILGNRFVTDLELADDRLIIGTDKGTYYINIATRRIGRLRDPDGNLGGLIRHIHVHEGELLISSDWGLTLVDLTTEKASSINEVGVPGAYAGALNDKYYAAVIDRGLLLVERKTGKQRVFTTEDGLLSVDINIMVAEGDYLWIGSDQGLTRFKWINPDRVD
jgi:hypothetical protein